MATETLATYSGTVINDLYTLVERLTAGLATLKPKPKAERKSVVLNSCVRPAGGPNGMQLSCELQRPVVTRANRRNLEPCGSPTFTVCAVCFKEVCLSCMTICCFMSMCSSCAEEHTEKMHTPSFWKGKR